MATILNTFLPKGSMVSQDTTALPTEVLSGKTFISKSTDGQSLKTGLMMNHGSSNLTITSSTGAIIPEGYYNGSGMASINLSLDDKTLASASNVLSGTSAFTNTGTRLDGTMVNRGAKNYTITTSAGATIDQGYHNGSGKVNLNLTLTSGKTAASADQILSGYQAFDSSGAQVSGRMPIQGAWSGSVAPGGSITIPAGWHDGTGKVTGAGNNMPAGARLMGGTWPGQNGKRYPLSCSFTVTTTDNWNDVKTTGPTDVVVTLIKTESSAVNGQQNWHYISGQRYLCIASALGWDWSKLVRVTGITATRATAAINAWLEVD